MIMKVATPKRGMFYDIMQMDQENYHPVPINSPKAEKYHCDSACTSEKVRHYLDKFPSSKPIPMKPNDALLTGLGYTQENSCRQCMGSNCKGRYHPIPQFPTNDLDKEMEELNNRLLDDQTRTTTNTPPPDNGKGGAWGAVAEGVQLLQLVVTTIALALYYFIYGCMQLIYTALRVALFFREADGPMKITIGVVAMTSLVVGFNILLRARKLYIEILP